LATVESPLKVTTRRKILREEKNFILAFAQFASKFICWWFKFIGCFKKNL